MSSNFGETWFWAKYFGLKWFKTTLQIKALDLKCSFLKVHFQTDLKWGPPFSVWYYPGGSRTRLVAWGIEIDTQLQTWKFKAASMVKAYISPVCDKIMIIILKKKKVFHVLWNNVPIIKVSHLWLLREASILLKAGSRLTWKECFFQKMLTIWKGSCLIQ